jgi:PAS domain S-box-containing protein
MKPGKPSRLFASFRSFPWFLLGAWTACAAGSLLWNLWQQSDHRLQMAKRKAGTVIEKSMDTYLIEAHVGLWLVGLIGIGIFQRSVGREIRAREQAGIDLQREVADRRRAEQVAMQRLREIEDLYRNAPVGLCVLDRELRWVRINERLAEINGLPVASHLGQRIRDLMPKLAESVEPEMQRVLETGQPRLNIEIVSETPGQPGVQRSWLEQWLPITDTEGQVIGLSIVVEETTELKRAAEELRMLALFPQENPNPVLRIARDGKILYANSASSTLLNAWQARLGGPVPPDWIQRVAVSLASGKVADTETTCDGRTFSCVLAPIADQGYVNLYAKDVTPLKQAEEALQRLNAELERRVAERTAELHATVEVVKAERRRLFDLLETLPVYVALFSTDHHMQFANRFFRERFGESKGRRCFECMFQRTEPCEACETFKVLQTGRPHHWEWTGPDGRDYDVHDFPFIETDGSQLILEVGIDVSGRKRAQRALESSEARYRSFVTASTQLVWTTDAQGLVAQDMPSWRAFTGQSFEQVQGWGLADALHPDDRQRTGAVWSQAVATRSLYAVEYRVRRHDGQYRWLSVRGVPVEAGGIVREWIGACTDITDLKGAEAETQRMREELARVDRAARLGELTASLAHELNQPLAAILSNAQAARRFLASDSPDLEQFREILDDIIQDDKRAGNVIHRIRLMLQKGKQEPETFRLNDAICEVVQLLHSEAVGRNATFKMDLAAGQPAVRAGRVEVQQVAVNLFINAMDAVRDVPPDRREILVRTRMDQGSIVVSVRDRGCGLPSPDFASIFEPFFTTKATGLGMGLAICRRIIETHGGRIVAANNEDAGATVSFSLPSFQAIRESRDD